MSQPSPVVASILILWSLDSGESYSEFAKGYLQGAYDQLPVEDQKFLVDLSIDDLSNIVAGEHRVDHNGDHTWNFNGAWQKLPPEVDRMLSNFWDHHVEGDTYVTATAS